MAKKSRKSGSSGCSVGVHVDQREHRSPETESQQQLFSKFDPVDTIPRDNQACDYDNNANGAGVVGGNGISSNPSFGFDDIETDVIDVEIDHYRLNLLPCLKWLQELF